MTIRHDTVYPMKLYGYRGGVVTEMLESTCIKISRGGEKGIILVGRRSLWGNRWQAHGWDE